MIKKIPTDSNRFKSIHFLLPGVLTLLLFLVANLTVAQECATPVVTEIEDIYDLRTECAQTLAPQSGGTYRVVVEPDLTYTFTICNPAGGTAVPYAELWDNTLTFVSASTDANGCAVIEFINCDDAPAVFLNVYTEHGTDKCVDDWYTWSMTTSCSESTFSCPEPIKLSISDATSCCFEGQFPLPDFSGFQCDADDMTLTYTTCAGVTFSPNVDFDNDFIGISIPLGVNTVTYTITVDGEEIICNQQVTITKAIACVPVVQVSLDHNCEAEVTASTFTSYSCPDDPYTVVVTVNGVQVTTLTNAHIGGTIIATVTDPHGNSCQSTVILEDKLGPKIVCPADVTLPCGADISVTALGDATATDCTDVGPVTVVTEGPNGDPCDGETYIRTWTASDALGNIATCSQTITLVRPDLDGADDIPNNMDDEIICPPNYIDPTPAGPNEMMLSCDNFPITSPPTISDTGGFIFSTDPATTTDDVLLQEGMFCNYLISKEDEIHAVCGGSYDILRVWTIRDWCDASNVKTCTQVIKVKDLTDPEGTAGTVSYSSEAHSCIGTVTLTPASWTDACSSMSTTGYITKLVQVTATGTGTVYSIPGNGGMITNVPLGEYIAVWCGQDECGNQGEIELEGVELTDDLAPVAVCDDKTVALGTNGEVWLCANTLDDGSYDNCQIVTRKVKRMDAAADVPFTDCIGLTCDDAVNGTVAVRFRAYDRTGTLLPSDDMPEAMGRFSECMTTITVQDKIRPTCGALPTINVSCGDDFTTHPDYATAPNAFDNCSFDFIALDDEGAATSCGNNVVVRRWRLIDPSDLAWEGPICTQTINIAAVPWTIEPTWPLDHTVDCSVSAGTDPTSLPAGASVPTFTTVSDDMCEDLVVGHNDKILENQPGACFIIIRTWKVYDLCQNPGYSESAPGFWSHNQKITIVDSQGPTFTVTPGNKIVDLGDNCTATFFLDPADATDVCSNNITITPNVPAGLTLNADGSYSATAGVYNVTYTAVDGCGNSTDLPITITINDVKAPSPICNGLISTTLMPQSGGGCMAAIWASDLHSGSSSDNCTATANLQYFVSHYFVPNGAGGQIVNTTLPTTTSIEYTENNIGSNLAQLWVVDEAGNADYCVVEIIIQDNLGVCIPCDNPTFTVAQDADNCSASVVNLTGGAAPYAYTWAPMQVSDPDFTFTICENSTTCGGLANGGVYQVTVTDANGCSTINEFTMTCTGDPCDGVDISINDVLINEPLCTEPGAASVTDITPGTVADYTYTWTDLAGNAIAGCTNGASCGTFPTGPGEYLVRATNAAGCSDVRQFSINCGMGRIGGVIENEEGGKVENVEVDVTGMSMNMTDQDGEYLFEDLMPGNNYTVTPEKDVNHTNGVTTYDLVLISQHILGVSQLASPYKIIAADANQSGSITTLDLVELRSLILQVYSEFPNNTSWRFIDKDFVFPNQNNPFATTFPEVISFNSFAPDELLADFIAVKIGDVNCTAALNNLLGSEERNFDGDLVLNVEDQQFEAGETVNVKFTSEQFEEMLGYQFTLEFDNEVMEFVDMNSGDLPNLSAGNFGLTKVDEGMITTSWNSSTGISLDKEDEMMNLNFVATGSGSLSTALKISSRATEVEAYKSSDESVELMNVVLGFNNGTETTIVEGAYELYQNTPNPFTTETKVGFNLPRNETATISVFDVSGKLIKQVKKDFAMGYNEVIFNKEELRSSGILYYQLQTSEFTDTRKMLLID